MFLAFWHWQVVTLVWPMVTFPLESAKIAPLWRQSHPQAQTMGLPLLAMLRASLLADAMFWLGHGLGAAQVINNGGGENIALVVGMCAVASAAKSTAATWMAYRWRWWVLFVGLPLSFVVSGFYWTPLLLAWVLLRHFMHV